MFSVYRIVYTRTKNLIEICFAKSLQNTRTFAQGASNPNKNTRVFICVLCTEVSTPGPRSWLKFVLQNHCKTQTLVHMVQAILANTQGFSYVFWSQNCLHQDQEFAWNLLCKIIAKHKANGANNPSKNKGFYMFSVYRIVYTRTKNLIVICFAKSLQNTRTFA